MIPRLSIGRRILAWLFWKYEGKHGWGGGFDKDDIDGAEYMLFGHESHSSIIGLMREYLYIKRAKEYENE